KKSIPILPKSFKFQVPRFKLSRINLKPETWNLKQIFAMPIEVKLPNLGDGIDTGDVLELLVKEGDTVAKDQGIVELETDKATLQVPSSAAGKVAKVHVKA